MSLFTKLLHIVCGVIGLLCAIVALLSIFNGSLGVALLFFLAAAASSAFAGGR